MSAVVPPRSPLQVFSVPVVSSSSTPTSIDPPRPVAGPQDAIAGAGASEMSVMLEFARCVPSGQEGRSDARHVDRARQGGAFQCIGTAEETMAVSATATSRAFSWREPLGCEGHPFARPRCSVGTVPSGASETRPGGPRTMRTRCISPSSTSGMGANRWAGRPARPDDAATGCRGGDRDSRSAFAPKRQRIA